MPGFGLAKKAIEVFERAKPSDGLILGKHGIVTFGDSAREGYERMIEMVSAAEDFVARRRKSVTGVVPKAANVAALTAVAPIVRGACSAKDEKIEGAWRRLVLDFRGADAVLNFLQSNDLARLSESGVITPDHTIRTKNWPLLLPAPQPGKLEAFARAAAEAAANFAGRYHRYFERHNKRVGGTSAHARSAAARGVGGRPRPVRPRPFEARCRNRSRHRRSMGRRRGRAEAIGRFESISKRKCSIAVLAAGTGKARRAEGHRSRSGRRHHPTRRRDRRRQRRKRLLPRVRSRPAMIDLSAATERVASAPGCRCAAT
jgi:rhamnose utilization protein RhaD (predicted bifunctional aldolase and dehydrogenase)